MFLHNALSGTVVIGCRLANELPMVYRPVERRCWFVVSHSIGRKLRLVSSKCAKDICRDGVNRFHLRLPRAGILLTGIVQQWNLVTYETSSCTWVGFPHFDTSRARLMLLSNYVIKLPLSLLTIGRRKPYKCLKKIFIVFAKPFFLV